MKILHLITVLILLIISKNEAQHLSLNIILTYEEDRIPLKQTLQSTLKKTNIADNVKVTYKMIELLKNETYESVCDKFRAVFSGDVSKPIVVFDATNHDPQSSLIKLVTRRMKLPTLSASFGYRYDITEWNDLTKQEEEFLVQVMPPSDIIGQMVHDIGSSQNLSNAGILYDDPFSMKHQYKSILVNLPVRQIMQEVKSEGEIEDQILNYKKNGIVNYFIFASSAIAENILELACKNGLVGDKHAWFIISKEETRLNVRCANMVFLYIYPEIIDKHLLSKLSSDYGIRTGIDSVFYFEMISLLIKAVSSEMKKNVWKPIAPLVCSTISNSSSNDLKLKSLLNMFLHETAYGKIILKENGRSFVELQMKIDEYSFLNTSLQVKSVGTWYAGMPGVFKFNFEKSISNYIAKKIYRVVTVETAPFIVKRKKLDGSFYFEGYCIDLLHEIQKIVRFDYEIYESPDGTYGAVDENGNWNGMIKELIDKKADIAIGPISVMAERENVVDFTVPYYDLVGITILMRKPKTPTSLFKFLNVLETEVWLCILAAYFVTSILMFLFDLWSPYSFRNNEIQYRNDDDEKREFNIKECLWFCMTSLTPQGGGEAPKNLSGRLVAATWWLFGFIVIASYTANLAAFLTVSRLDTSITSLDDLAKQYKFQFAPSEGTSSMTYFRRMADIEDKFYEIWKDMSLDENMDEVERAKLAVWDYPVSDRYTRMWNAMKQAGLPKDYTSAVDRVRNSNFAFIADSSILRFQAMTDCDLKIVGAEFSRKPLALGIQKGSALKDVLSVAILQLLNIRTLETLKEKWWDKNPLRKNCEASESMSDGISIANIGGVFIVIFIGIGLASFALGFEYLRYRRRQRPAFIPTNKTKVIQVEKPKKSHIDISSYNQ